MDVHEYVAKQTALLLYPLVVPRRRRRYTGLLVPGPFADSRTGD